jgi:transposase-like protein
MGGKIFRPLKKNEIGFGTPTIKGRIHIDEKYVNVAGQHNFDLNGMDYISKFILTEMFVKSRTLIVCKALYKRVKDWCNAQIMDTYRREMKKPVKKRQLITFVSDEFKNYKTAWKKLFYRTTTLHHGVPIACRKYGLTHNNNPIERYNREIKRRIIVLTVFQTVEGARALLGLRTIIYNYITPHASLNGKTPAEVAMIKLELGENKLLNLISLARKIEMTKT